MCAMTRRDAPRPQHMAYASLLFLALPRQLLVAPASQKLPATWRLSKK
jgi:hypothetical protein